MIETLSATTEHQRVQIAEYVERVGTATIEHAGLKLQITTLEGKERLSVLVDYAADITIHQVRSS